MNRVLIFAGGKGVRMKTEDNIPKQFLKIKNKYILIHTLEKFERCEDIDDIIIVCIQGWIEELKHNIQDNGIKKVSAIISGGLTGFESRLNGLKYCYDNKKTDNDIVLIHDGVRPFVTTSLITENINCTKNSGNAITVAPLNETLVYTATTPASIFERGNCFLARAPQTFFVNDIYRLYERALMDNKSSLIDSASIANYYGVKLNYVIGPEENIKITTPLDFYIAKGILESIDKNTEELR